MTQVVRTSYKSPNKRASAFLFLLFIQISYTMSIPNKRLQGIKAHISPDEDSQISNVESCKTKRVEKKKF